jgi:hypothetical protein
MFQKMWLAAMSLTIVALAAPRAAVSAEDLQMCVLENHPCTASTPCCPNLTCWDESGQGHEGVCKPIE